MNAEDGGNRQFILVQLPEKINEKDQAYQAGYKTIDEITCERVKRAINKIKEENPNLEQKLGFKHLVLSKSAFPKEDHSNGFIPCLISLIFFVNFFGELD